MCLGVPGKILDISEDESLRSGRVAFGGVAKKVVLAYVPEAKVGDFVIVHAGFAISVVDEEEAEFVFSYLRQMGELDELGEPSEVPGTPPNSVQAKKPAEDGRGEA